MAAESAVTGGYTDGVMPTRLPMDSPQDEMLYLRELPEAERQRLVGAMMKRYLLEQEARKEMATKEEVIKRLMAERRLSKAAFEIPPGLKSYLPWIGGGALLGGLSGALHSPEDEETTTKQRVLRGLGGAVYGGGVGGALRHLAGPTKSSPTLDLSPGSVADRTVNPEILGQFRGRQQTAKAVKMETPGIIEKIKSKIKGHPKTPSADELADWFKQSSLYKEALNLPQGMHPAHLGSLIGAGLGGVTGLIGAKATEGEDEGKLKRILKRLGAGAAGAAGGAMLGAAAPGAHAVYQDGGLKGLKQMKGPLWDVAKTVPIETAQRAPGWLKNLFVTPPKTAADFSPDPAVEEAIQKLQVMVPRGSPWDEHSGEGSFMDIEDRPSRVGGTKGRNAILSGFLGSLGGGLAGGSIAPESPVGSLLGAGLGGALGGLGGYALGRKPVEHPTIRDIIAKRYREGEFGELDPAALKKIYYPNFNIGTGPELDYGQKAASEEEDDLFIEELTEEMNKALGKTATVKQEGGKWVLYTKDGSRVLGRHDSAKGAYAQEKAIQVSKARRKAAAEGPRAVIREPGATEMESGREVTPEEYIKMRSRMFPGGLIGGATGAGIGSVFAQSPEAVLPAAGVGGLIGAGGGALANYLLTKRRAKKDIAAFQEKFPGLLKQHLEGLPEDQRPGPFPGPGEEVVYSAPREHLKVWGLPKMAGSVGKALALGGQTLE